MFGRILKARKPSGKTTARPRGSAIRRNERPAFPNPLPTDDSPNSAALLHIIDNRMKALGAGGAVDSHRVALLQALEALEPLISPYYFQRIKATVNETLSGHFGAPAEPEAPPPTLAPLAQASKTTGP
uniref:Uncharacterized protein n=1 Tax=Caenorhabditis tropicalis TaxID=1561998 RepID=A0A1I7UIN5_9PELO